MPFVNWEICNQSDKKTKCQKKEDKEKQTKRVNEEG